MSQFRDLIARMAIDPEFARFARRNPDDVAHQYGLNADQTEQLRGLADAATPAGPMALGARLSKSGIGTGGLAAMISPADGIDPSHLLEVSPQDATDPAPPSGLHIDPDPILPQVPPDPYLVPDGDLIEVPDLPALPVPGGDLIEVPDLPALPTPGDSADPVPVPPEPATAPVEAAGPSPVDATKEVTGTEPTPETGHPHSGQAAPAEEGAEEGSEQPAQTGEPVGQPQVGQGPESEPVAAQPMAVLSDGDAIGTQELLIGGGLVAGAIVGGAAGALSGRIYVSKSRDDESTSHLGGDHPAPGLAG